MGEEIKKETWIKFSPIIPPINLGKPSKLTCNIFNLSSVGNFISYLASLTNIASSCETLLITLLMVVLFTPTIISEDDVK